MINVTETAFIRLRFSNDSCPKFPKFKKFPKLFCPKAWAI